MRDVNSKLKIEGKRATFIEKDNYRVSSEDNEDYRNWILCLVVIIPTLFYACVLLYKYISKRVATN